MAFVLKAYETLLPDSALLKKIYLPADNFPRGKGLKCTDRKILCLATEHSREY